MEITQDQFEAYEAIRMSGVTNMFDVVAVEMLSGLPRYVITDIMKNYAAYKAQFMESETSAH